MVDEHLVQTVPVFGRRDWPAYLLLTGLLAWAVARAILAASETLRTGGAVIAWLPVGGAAAVGLVLYLGRWLTLPLMRRPRPAPVRTQRSVAVVTTFVPGAEPLEMLEESVRAMVALRQPHDTWVLDEGNDDEVAALCRKLGARHFSRLGIDGYQQAGGRFQTRTKHGNYNAWLDAVGFEAYEVIVNFDPDHVPAPAFLERTLGYLDDPEIGYVQAAQVYYNQDESLVARGAAEETYTYYASVQMSSFALGYPIVTGCHTVHRSEALREVGGFAPHEADDLLVTVLYRAANWRGVYVPEALALGLVPGNWAGYVNQQRRWARSVLDIKFRVFPGLAHRLSLVERVVSFCHGLYYLHGLASGALVVLLVVGLLTGFGPERVSSSDVSRIGLVTVALVATDLFRQRFLLDRSREFGIHWRSGLLRFAKWPYVLLALFDVARNRYGNYQITPKASRARGSSARGLAGAHLAAGGAVALGLLAGHLAGRSEPPAATVASAFVAMSVGIAATVIVCDRADARTIALDPDRYSIAAEASHLSGPSRRDAYIDGQHALLRAERPLVTHTCFRSTQP